MTYKIDKRGGVSKNRSLRNYPKLICKGVVGVNSQKRLLAQTTTKLYIKNYHFILCR